MWEKFKKNKFYLGWKKLIDDMKPMTWKQRADHIYTYYREYLIFVFFGIIMLGLVVTIISSQSKENVIRGIAVNTSLRPECLSYMTDEYKADLGITDKNKSVELEYTTFGDPMDPENGQNSYYASMILTSRVSGAMLDYMLLDKFAMEYYIAQEVYMDLREFFTQEELDVLEKEKRLIYAQQEGQEDRWVIAVDISDIPFTKDNVTNEGKTYFALSGNVRSLENYRSVWERINAWESESK